MSTSGNLKEQSPAAAVVREHFRAMASDICFEVVNPSPAAPAAIAAAKDVFSRIESSCTRFDPHSPLMRANARGDELCRVPVETAMAVAAARWAYARTRGRFDPRILTALEANGYDRSLPFAKGVQLAGDFTPSVIGSRPQWAPEIDVESSCVRIGPEPIDLGGIGKGLAVRSASNHLVGAGEAFMVEAGGDCYLSGNGPDGTGWRIAVEDPMGASQPVAVLELSDLAVVTSSIRLRRWRVGDKEVHHLIDPRTNQPGGQGLLSVTVVGPDPAEAEVWSKVLFLAGRDGVSGEANREGLTALWVDLDGVIGCTPTMASHEIWRRSGV